MEWISDPNKISAIFALVGLIATVILMLRSDKTISIQLLGSLLVISICFLADQAVVSIISVFVIATLVTELQFLEKIAALIWNRKEYWEYLSGKATKSEITDKAKKEIEDELQKNELDGPNEAEAVDESAHEPEGITSIEESEPFKDKNQLVSNALQFEKQVFDNLSSRKIPFQYKNIKNEVSITSGTKRLLIDGIIETDDVHYLIEVKAVSRPSSLVNAVHQVEMYKSFYESYLRERNIRVAVQPLIIVPKDLSLSGNFRGVPIIKYDVSSKTFSNFKASYSDYQLNKISEPHVDSLSPLLVNFLKQYSSWAFSPLRIQKWGVRQAGYELFDLYTTNEIRANLEKLLSSGVLEERTSKQGNKLYRIKL